VTESELAELHRRASEWFTANNYTNDAVRHGLATGQTELAVTLIEKVIIGMLADGEVNTILNWLRVLPDNIIRHRPRLSLGKAWAGLIINRFSEMEAYLSYAEAELAPYQASPGPHPAEIEALLGEAAALRAIVLDFQGNAQAAVTLCRQALTRLPQESQLVRSIILMTLGNSYQVLGAFAEATEALKESVALSLARSGPVVAVTALGNLANLQREQGLLRQAAETYQQAMTSVSKEVKAGKRLELTYPLTRWAYLGLAELHREWNELEDAERQLAPAFQAAEQGHYFGDLTIAHIIQAQILRAKGQIDEALATLRQAKNSLSASPIVPWLQAVEARLWLAQGNLAAARAWAARSGLPSSDPEGYIHLPGEHTTLVRLWLAEEKFEAATDLLHRMATTFMRDHRNGRLVEVLMLQALTLFAQGKRDQVLGPLAQALGLGQKGGFVRLFVDEGPAMSQLLQQSRARLDTSLQPYVDRLLTASGELQTGSVSRATTSPLVNRQTKTLIEPLSDRELEVLHLIAAGLSNQEIADQLIIAEGTVKKHIHNIFGKLDVRRRSQAILRATDLGLI
jgi:LuxR family maltose regulon positive regulatory protein